MRKPCYQACFLLIALFAFGCLLISGSPRLIAVQEDSPAQAFLSSQTVALIASVGVQSDTQPLSQRAIGEKRIEGEDQRIAVQPEICELRGCLDANGNVIAKTDYLDAVYLVFVSGDGFA